MSAHAPVRGVGIGLRKAYADALPSIERRIDFVEIVPENVLGRGGRARARLDAAAARWPVLAHGVSASIGGPDPFDAEHVRQLKEVLDRYEVAVYSDHLCWVGAGGWSSHDLLPLPFTEEAVRHAAGRVRELADRLERPVALENISFYAIMPGSRLDEPDFVRAVCEEAGCGLMLDVNNVVVNARNHGRDAAADLLRLPLDRVVQIHVAGHELQGHRVIDTHGAPVDAETHGLLALAAQHVGDVPVLLEWDTSIPSLDRVLDEADAVRATWESARASSEVA